MLADLAHTLGNLVWSQSACRICHAWPLGPWCPSCLQRFAAPRPRCQRCALPVAEGVAVCGACQSQPPPLDACWAAVDYAYPWSHAIAQFKFQQEPGLQRPLALLLAGIPGLGPVLQQAAVVLPIPSSARRLQHRGYNPAALLAQALAPQTTQTRWLLRLGDPAPQHELPRAQRLLAQEGTLALDPLHAPQLRHRPVLLVDDVMTTGATLHAAARVLRHAGAAPVWAVVLARTP